MSKNIRQQVQRAIYAGEPLAWAVQERQPGVRWTATGEFIPLADLNFNESLGFYRVSANPDAVGLCTNEPEDTIHRVIFPDPWDAYAWSDNLGTLTLLGEPWQIADLYQVLGRALDGPGVDPESVTEDDPNWGTSGDMTWATREAVRYGWYSGEETPLRDKLKKAGHRIRRAAQRGTIRGAARDDTGHWFFRKPAFRGWLHKVGERQGGEEPQADAPTPEADPRPLIEEHVAQAIAEGMPGRLVVQDGVPGVVFPDENKFIPFADLNYNPTYGYYEMSAFPDLARDCRN